MARKYEINFSTEIADIATAIADYYGVGNYTIHYQTTEYLVFEIPAVCDKVMRIRILYNTAGGTFAWGDAWTSGSTITNAVAIHSYFQPIQAASYLVLSPNCFKYFSMNSYGDIIIVGKTSNGLYAAFGFLSNSGLSSRGTPKISSDNSNIYPLVFSSQNHNIKTASNKTIKIPLYIINSTGQIITDNDDNPIYMLDTSICKAASILDADNIFIYYSTFYYNIYTTYGGFMAAFIDEIDNYTL
jgi:hypothetical protein